MITTTLSRIRAQHKNRQIAVEMIEWGLIAVGWSMGSASCANPTAPGTLPKESAR